MSDPIDDLLAQIQADQPAPPIKPATPPAPESGSSSSTIDNLLADLDGIPAKPQASAVSQPSANPRFDALIHQTPAPDSAEASPELFKAETSDRLLADLKTLYQDQDQAEALRQQQERRAEQERLATLKRQRQGAINRQAEDWLKKLDPASGEAAWFEEFAAKYESRLQAAVDYLGLEGE